MLFTSCRYGTCRWTTDCVYRRCMRACVRVPFIESSFASRSRVCVSACGRVRVAETRLAILDYHIEDQRREPERTEKTLGDTRGGRCADRRCQISGGDAMRCGMTKVVRVLTVYLYDRAERQHVQHVESVVPHMVPQHVSPHSRLWRDCAHTRELPLRSAVTASATGVSETRRDALAPRCRSAILRACRARRCAPPQNRTLKKNAHEKQREIYDRLPIYSCTVCSYRSPSGG